MKLHYLVGVLLLPFLLGCQPECGYGLQMVGRNYVITGPSGNVASLGTINTGSIQNQTTYAQTSQRVTDLVQQMQLCCQAKVQAQKAKDKALADKWGNEEVKAFDAMLDLQKQLPSSNQPAAAPVAGTTPKPTSPPATAQPSGGAKPAANAGASPTTVAATPPASTKKVKGWLTRSSQTLKDLKKKTSQAAATSPQ